ncbi:MAG TPA: deoxyguanosinetriphosphate triphosphohydrolase [Capsulimonadaceae bacterium]|nr:deoxyguanosinetriphosphate triphosphohydrolase [Capsulimonadaceae bacterium]
MSLLGLPVADRLLSTAIYGPHKEFAPTGYHDSMGADELANHPDRFRLAAETREVKELSPHAALSAKSLGRRREEPKDPVRTDFQRDRDRILHSKSFRRLKHKTQVFIDPEEDHYRTRLTHTLEVAQIARTIARALRLNEDLTEAITLAHDLGHTPFGHGGEEAIDEVLQEYVPGTRFRHYEQSLRIVDTLEKDGKGLNLTWEVRDGILGHSKGTKDLGIVEGTELPETLEGMVVRISDRIAYINHDIDDASRAGVLNPADLPPAAIEALGRTHAKRIGTMVMNVILSSEDEPEVRMTGEVLSATNLLKDYMYANVYLSDRRGNIEMAKARRMLKQLFRLYMDDPRVAPASLLDGQTAGEFAALPVEARAQRVTDFIAGMTDRYATHRFKDHFFPEAWSG